MGERPVLALTMGDPAGIGGEITVSCWRELRARGAAGPIFMVLADPDWLAGFGVPVQVIERVEQAPGVFGAALPVLPVRLDAAVTPGVPSVANAGAVIRSIELAVELALGGAVGAVVTNPIAKSVLYQAGFGFPGHTEFLGFLTGCAHPVMMLAGPELRVVPVSVHEALRVAVAGLCTEAIITAGMVTQAALIRDFGIARPRLAVAGLNPHAGEAGAMGDEEGRIIAPAVAALRAQGVAVVGPLPPDTMFTAEARRRYDAAICMYHDQALIPLKTLDVERSVNITLGLPIIRTSPDHGTAFDIAGRGVARAGSLLAALEVAASMAVNLGARS
ncbi:4-hydroxythreonine-4-phosphate dehydrogenase [Acidiphilium sp. MT5]